MTASTTKIILIVSLLVLVFVINLIISRLTHYECPQCGTHFQSNGFDAFKPHYMGEREESCPSCGYTGLMRRYRGRE